MARHTITVDELDNWLRTPQWQPVACSFGKDSGKRLEIDAGSDGLVFRVTDHGETRFLGTNRSAAVAAYNEAP